MKLEQRFHLSPAPSVIWESLKDSRLMAECLPGAELETMTDPDQLEGRLTVRLGPIVAGFDGTVTIIREDELHRGTMHARGVDKRTGTRVRAKICYALAELDGGTEVMLTCDVSIMGALAQFTRKGLIDKVTKDLISDFAEALEARLTRRGG